MTTTQKPLLGAIIGDIVGSRFEFKNRLSTDFELFASDCEFTDDTARIADMNCR